MLTRETAILFAAPYLLARRDAPEHRRWLGVLMVFGVWGGRMALVLDREPRGRLATGLVAATLLASPLFTSAPRPWRALAILFITSAGWTVAVALRFLISDAVRW